MSAMSVVRGPEVRGPMRRIGRYDLCAQLASGGMATVWLARMRGPAGFQKLVALKTIHPHLVDQEGFIEMFLDEARLVSRIEHPHVAAVLDFGVAEGTYFLAMELLVGETLGRIHRYVASDRRRLADPEYTRHIARIVGDAAEGLHVAHELVAADGTPLAVIHRDVSLQNVLVTFEGQVKVMDFGVAQALDQIHVTHAGTLKGTPSYMAPEQLEHGAVDRRVDVWGLGVVPWELLTGERLFQREREVDVIRAVLSDPIEAPSSRVAGVGPALDAIVMRALARKPDERYPTAHEMAVALRKVSEADGATSGPERLGPWLTGLFPELHAEWNQRVEEARRASVEGAIAEAPPADGDATRATVVGRRKRSRWLAPLTLAAVMGALAIGAAVTRGPSAASPCAGRPDGEPCTGGLCAASACQAVACAEPFPVAQATAGENHACAVDRAGGLWCWGRNDHGQVGIGDLRARVHPVRLALSDRMQAVSAGPQHTCAIGAPPQRRLWCWGRGRDRQLGLTNRTGADRLSPAPLQSSGDWSQVAGAEMHTCGIRDGSLLCWGRSSVGQLGSTGGEFEGKTPSPVDVPPSLAWTQVTASRTVTCALEESGGLYCWGAHARQPAHLAGVWAGLGTAHGSHLCAVAPDGALSCWGDNTHGQLGVDDTQERKAPTPVRSRERWRQVSAGQGHTCGITVEGALMCWGSNEVGQLGVPTAGDRWNPGPVASATRWLEVVAGASFTCAIRSDAALLCWGRSDFGELGNDVTARFAPTPVCFPR